MAGENVEGKIVTYNDQTYTCPTGAEIFNSPNNKAIGLYSHAEGHGSVAYGAWCHAEGINTYVSGNGSHAEGQSTIVDGFGSHAEGANTKASGNYIHVEGYNTIASSNYQHVQGKYNVEDTEEKYEHIVGNGTENTPSNAHTLDWDGNAWYQGDVYVGSNSGVIRDEGSKKLATEDFVSEKFNQLSQEKVDQADAVLVIPQTLTDDQKAQARTNIGAASEADKITISYDAENKIVRFLSGGVTPLELPAEKVGEYYKLLTDITLTAAGVPADAAAVGERFGELSEEIVDLNSSAVKVVKQSSVPSDTTVLWIDPSDNTGSGTIEQEANYQYIFKKNITDDYFWFWTESAGDTPYKYAYSGYSLVEPITLEAGTYCLSALMIAYSWIVTESGGLQRIDAFEPSSDKTTGYFTLTLTETSTLYLAYHTSNQVSEVTPYLIKGNKPLNPGDYYEGVEDVSPEIFDYGVFIESYIKNCELVANELVGDNIGEAKGHYTGVKMDSNIRKIMCKAKLISNSSVALITTSLGSSKVTDITFGSVHLVFGVNRCSVGVFDTRDSLRLVQSLGYVITEGAEVSFGFDIDEQNNTLTVYLPDGTTQSVTDSVISSLNGKYAIWEHFCNTSTGAFACSRMTKFYCKDADGEVLEDDFKRFDGAIGVAPTGQVYRQFTSHNGNNRDYK